MQEEEHKEFFEGVHTCSQTETLINCIHANLTKELPFGGIWCKRRFSRNTDFIE